MQNIGPASARSYGMELLIVGAAVVTSFAAAFGIQIAVLAAIVHGVFPSSRAHHS
jgi:hypothetical protein